MTPRAKRNLANILILLSIVPVLIWILLMAMAADGALFPWIAVSLFLSGPYIIVTLLVLVSLTSWWIRYLKENNPTVWTTPHKIPFITAKIVMLFGIAMYIGVYEWTNFLKPPPLPLTQKILTIEEQDNFQKQFDKKLLEIQNQQR